MQSTQRWKIDRYARFHAAKSNNGGEWIHYDDSSYPMALTVTDVHQLVITQGMAILESHSLLSARAWMRGLCRNDSLLFVCKMQIAAKTETRKFRVRFGEIPGQSGVDQCKACVEELHNFFPIKLSVVKHISAAEAQDQSQNTGAGNALKQDKLEGEVTLGDITQALMSNEQLPLAYQHHPVSPSLVQQMLRVCLADPAFPAFVASVETALKEITDDSTEQAST